MELSVSETGGLIWRRWFFLSAHTNKHFLSHFLCRSTLTFQPFGIHQWNQWFGWSVVFRLVVAFIIQGFLQDIDPKCNGASLLFIGSESIY